MLLSSTCGLCNSLSTHLDVVLCLVEQPQRGVPGRVRADGHHVLQLLQAVAQVRAAVLLKLVVGGPGGGEE